MRRVLKEYFGEPSIDYEAFSNRLCEGAERLRTYYYDCMPLQSDPPTPEERRLYSGMDRFLYNIRRLSRFEVRLGKLIFVPSRTSAGYVPPDPRHGRFVQKGVDVLLSVDLVRMSWDKQIQRAVLVTGDSDFVPAVSAAKDAGVLTQLYYSRHAVHDELLAAFDDRFPITQELIDSVRRTK